VRGEMEMNYIAPGASGGADGSDDVVQHSKNPLEKLRVRLAAENYNRPGSYQTMTDDNDNEQPPGYSSCVLCLLYSRPY